VDAIRIGLSLRALRIRRGWRQLDVAIRAGVSRGTVSNLERGLLARTSLDALIRVAAATGADVDVRVRWRGEQLDRLLDEGHARLADAMAARLRQVGWTVGLEVTFSIWGERGSVDVLAYHPSTGTVLVIEVKTIVPDFQAMVATLDRKARLAPEIAGDRGWACREVGRLLVIEEGSTSRDRIGRLGAAVGAVFPNRGPFVRSWLRAPSGGLSGLLFVRSATAAGLPRSATGRQRVRRFDSARSATPGGVSPESRPQTPAPVA
jgi:transcriptional regulator with XRE-family HTH domain